MAGVLSGNKKQASEILFDLTPEDDQLLKEADLLQFVNHGQLQDKIDIPGTDGRKYVVEIALLWDDDHIDLLRRTTAYVSDPLLRVKLIRRLKLHKAIQKIDNLDYSNKEDPTAQRQLWAMLTKLSDTQMEYLDSQYSKLELTRNMAFLDVLKGVSEKLASTVPSEIKPKSETVVTTAEEHEQLIKQRTTAQQGAESEIADVILQHTIQEPVEGAKIVSSPKQVLE